MPKRYKKDRAMPNLQPQYKLTKELEQKHSKNKKKKNAPDRPQPAWLFPPDEENPVLNPTPKSEAQRQKDKEQHDASIDFLHRKSVSATMKPAPPGLLLTLVGAFLSSYGLDSASRLFTAQIEARSKLGDWKAEIGKPLPKGYPQLIWIFKDFQKKWELDHGDDTTSGADSSDDDSISDRDSEEAPKAKRSAAAAAAKVDNTSDNESRSDGQSESDEKKVSTSDTSPPKSLSSSSSVSKADAGAKPVSMTDAPAKPTVHAEASRDDASSSPSASDQDTDMEDAPPAKASAIDPSMRNPSDSSTTLEGTPPIKAPSVSDDSTSLSSSSDSEPSPDEESGARITPPPTSTITVATTKISNKRKKSESPPPAENGKKQKKKVSERFRRIPADTQVDPKFASNAYQSYDYADKAHQDLSITKGKGFMKEKNKKKRGSYRGGAIDVNGGKGVRFD